MVAGNMVVHVKRSLRSLTWVQPKVSKSPHRMEYEEPPAGQVPAWRMGDCVGTRGQLLARPGPWCPRESQDRCAFRDARQAS